MRDRKHFLALIETVAHALEELLPDFTFIGGATLPNIVSLIDGRKNMGLFLYENLYIKIANETPLEMPHF